MCSASQMEKLSLFGGSLTGSTRSTSNGGVVNSTGRTGESATGERSSTVGQLSSLMARLRGQSPTSVPTNNTLGETVRVGPASLPLPEPPKSSERWTDAAAVASVAPSAVAAAAALATAARPREASLGCAGRSPQQRSPLGNLGGGGMGSSVPSGMRSVSLVGNRHTPLSRGTGDSIGSLSPEAAIHPAASSSAVSAVASGGVGEAGLQQLETRITSVEEELKGLNANLKEHQQDPEGALALRARVYGLLESVEGARQERKAFEERAQRLKDQLRQERAEREAWLEAFLAALKKTFTDLTSCVDTAISDSSAHVQGSMNEAEEMMSKLILRVEDIFGPEQDYRLPRQSIASKLSDGVTRSRPSVGSSGVRMHSARGTGSAATAPVSAAASLRTSPASSRSASQTRDVFAFGTVAQADLKALAQAAAKPGEDGDQILRSWTGLLNENMRLQKQQQDLLTRRKLLASSESAGGRHSVGASRYSKSVGHSPLSVLSPTSNDGVSPACSSGLGTRPLHHTRPTPQLAAVPER